MVTLARRMGSRCPVDAWIRTVSALRAQPCRRRGTALLRVHCRPASGRYGRRSRMSRVSLPRKARRPGTVPGPQSGRSPGDRLRSRRPRRRRCQASALRAALPGDARPPTISAAWVPVLTAALDYLENLGIWTLLLTYPSRPDGLVRVLALTTPAKLALGQLSLVLVGLLLLALVLVYLWTAAGPASQRTMQRQARALRGLGMEGYASPLSVPTPLGLALELGWAVWVAVIAWRLPVRMTTPSASAGDG